MRGEKEGRGITTRRVEEDAAREERDVAAEQRARAAHPRRLRVQEAKGARGEGGHQQVELRAGPIWRQLEPVRLGRCSAGRSTRESSC